MRVLYVAHNYHPMNASSITTCEIVRRLAEKGHEPTLLVPQRCSKECLPNCSLRCKDDTNIAVARIPTLIPYYLINKYTNLGALILSFCHLFLILRGIKICREKSVEVIVSQHHPSHFASFSAFVLSSIFKLPLIVKTHDVFNSSYSVLQSLFLCMLDNIFRIVFKRADCILVVSNPLRLRMIEIYKLKKDKVLVFPNGVDTKKFRPNVSSDSLRRDLCLEGKKIMLFIGKIREERGLKLLIKALPKVVAKTSNLIVLIIGEGPKKFDLERQTHELGLESFVKFVRPVNHNQIPKYICMSDVTVGPLVATIDTFGSVPRKVLEYMACAKPVVTCHGGVSEDLITEGYSGFLVHPEKVEELTALILKIVSSPYSMKEVGLNARRYVEKFHDWDKIINLFEKALHTALT